MKAMTRRLIIPATLAATFAISPLVWSGEHNDCDRGDHRPMHHDGKDRRADMQARFDHMAERLKLTDEQRDQMRDIFKQGHEARKARWEAMRENRPELFSGDPASSDYKASVKADADRAAEAARARVEARAESYAAIYQVLNDEQREIWTQMQTERREHRGDKHHQGPEDHDEE